MKNKYIDDKISNELDAYWNEVNKDIDIIDEVSSIFHKWTRGKKRKKQISLKKGHRGTNWKSKKPKKGFARIKGPGGKTYIYKRLSAAQKITKKRMGQKLGTQSKRFK